MEKDLSQYKYPKPVNMLPVDNNRSRKQIFHSIFGKEIFKLAVELSCQGFIMTQHKGWPVDLIDYVGNGKSLSRTGNSQ